MRSTVMIASLVLALGPFALAPASIAADSGTKHVSAKDLEKEPVSATFEFEGKQLRLLVGGASGKGVLHFKGKDYPFTAKGASVGGVGAAEVHAVGEVRYLNKIEDFAGQYSGLTAGLTVVKGKGASTFGNDQGVVISVKQKSDGMMLGLGVSGFVVTLSN